MYAMYLRKSRADLEAEARGQFETLRSHEERLTKLAQDRGLEVGKIYRELVSGDTIAARPEMQQLLDDVRAGVWEGVLVTEISRLARGDTRDQGTVFDAFRLSKTLIVTPEKTYDPTNELDQDFFDFSLFMARQEYKYIKRRMQAGSRQKRQDGFFLGGVPPYGYRKIPSNIEPDPAEAAIVREIFRLAGEGKTRGEISRILNSRGLRKRNGEPWESGTVHIILDNPAYIGKARINRNHWAPSPTTGQMSRHRNPLTLVDARWEPLISREVWDAVPLRSATEPKTKDGFRFTNPLAGLLVCKKCGRMLRLDKTHGHFYFKHAVTPLCSCVSVSKDLVMRELVAALKAAIENAPVETEEKEPDHSALFAQLRQAEAKVNRIYSFLESGVYSPDEFNARIAPAKKALEALRREVEAVKKAPKKGATVLHIHDAFDAMLTEDPSTVNQSLKVFIDRITYLRERKEDEPVLEVWFR